MTPQIFTYATDDPHAPAHRRFMAAMDGAAPGRHWICHGATADEAREKLAAFWATTEGPGKTKAKAAKANGAAQSDDDFEVI